MQRAIRFDDFAQRAIHAKANAGVALVRLDMDVACAIARGLRQQRVEHADDGGVVRRFEQILDGRQVLHHARQIGIALDLAHHGGGAGFALCIGGADALDQHVRWVHLDVVHAKFSTHFARA